MSRARHLLVTSVLTSMAATALVVGGAAAPSHASTAGEQAALATLQASWDRLSMQQKLGTCNAYRRNATVMVSAAADFQWKRPIAHQGMTKASWRRVYRQYFAWACSGAGRSPRP